MTERGAVPDNGIAVEPREAQRPTLLAARTPQAAALGNRVSAVGAQAGFASLPCGRRSAPPWRLPALHPLIFEGEKEKGIRAYPAPGKTKNTGGGALAIFARHSGARAKLASPESRGRFGANIWIPGPALRAVPE